MKKGFYKSLDDLINTYDIAKALQIGVVFGLSLALLDYYDLPSKLFYMVPSKVFFTILIGFSLLMAVWLFANHIFDLFKICATNPLDIAAFTAIIVSVVYSFFRCWILGAFIYSTIALGIALMLLAFLMHRLIVRGNKYDETDKQGTNLVDLKDLYNNNVSRVGEHPILIKENDVDYDLFDRSKIINRLYDSIVHCQPESSYVISLEGEWGCGKTTIINNVKKLLKKKAGERDDIIIIDDFDPWLFGSQEALLLAMYDTLFQRLGLHYSPLRSNFIAKSIIQTVSEHYPAGGLLYGLYHNESKQGDDVQVLKKRISACIRTSNKKVVFFIDNLDRAADSNVVFLFKLISIVFDLPGVVYVLSFERERINSILKTTSELDSRFTEKIIQQEITVPVISEEKTKSIYSVCTCNIIEAYGICGKELLSLAPAVKYIISQTSNIRMFKRVLNSVFPAVFCDKTILNKSDLLAIEAIRFFDFDLYTTIFENKEFFVSHGKSQEEQISISFGTDKFNEQGKSFYQELLSRHSKSKELLKTMFPYAERYMQGCDLEPKTHFPDTQARKIEKESRICSGKFFDLYFSHGSNSFLEIRSRVELFINVANSADSISKAISITENALHEINEDEHQEWVEQLQSHLPDVLPNKAYYMAYALFSSLFHINNDSSFLALSPQSRAEYIISKLLTMCTEDEFEAFLNSLKSNYDKLYTIHNIVYWLNSSSQDNIEISKKRAVILQGRLNDSCEKILSENINIYSIENYHEKNAWALYHYCKDRDENSRFTAYIAKCLSPLTVYKIVWDITTEAMGRDYRYSISDENLNAFCADTALLENVINTTEPNNNDEQFVKKVFESSIYGKEDVWGHKGVSVSTHKSLKL